MLKPLKRRTLAEEIIEQIKEEIVLGNYMPGDRLPPERALGDKFLVSRASVREAMRALAAIGLIEIRAGEGTFLSVKASSLFSEDLSSKLLLNKKNLLETIEARKIIEVNLVKLATERASEEDIYILEQILVNMHRKIEHNQSFAEDDIAFHIQIANMAGNMILYETLSTIRQLLKGNYQEVVKVKGMDKVAYEQHKEILKAIKNHAVDEACDVMRKHLAEVEDKIMLNGEINNE